jgi:hypothetical protein
MAQGEVFPINIWINEERLAKLQQAGLADMTTEMFAGLRRLQVPANEAQKDTLLKKYPNAKYDSATTKTIELLPRDVKDQIFDLVVQKRSLDVLDAIAGS